jgi:UDP-sugar transporter A1/2/3
MAIFSTGAAVSPGVGGGDGVGKHAALILLTFQNSALNLIMHYSRIMPSSGDHRYFTSTAVLLNEVIKLALSLTLAIHETSKTLAPSTPATVLFEQIYNSVFSVDGWQLAIPATFYTLQNMLQYNAVSNLDAVHVQVLYQLKILITALLSVVLLRRSLSVKRWASLIILTFGVSIVSLPSSDSVADSLFFHSLTDHFFPRSMHELGQLAEVLPDPHLSRRIDDLDEFSAEPHLMRRSASYQGIADDLPQADPLMNYSVGIASVLVAAVVSSLAGVYFEKILKESTTQANVWIRNVQLSLYSLVAAFFMGVVWQDGAGIREHGFFEGYNWVVWSLILLQAVGGLIASIVIRDVGNIVKNFATSISIVISFLISRWMFGFEATPMFLLGISLVLLATYLYNGGDRKIYRPAPLRIANFEKTAIERTLTPRTTPRLMPEPGRMTLEPYDAKGLGMSTSRPSSPMPRQASRTHIRREE